MSGSAERSLRAKVAAHASHARRDPREATARARAALLSRFENEADPDGVLPPEERRRRAEQLWRAHMGRMALASARARSQQSDTATTWELAEIYHLLRRVARRERKAAEEQSAAGGEVDGDARSARPSP